MGTTVATNALLERKGSKCALLITKGFGDLMVIGDQSRPNLFELNVRKPGQLCENVVEIDGRVTQESFAEDPLEQSFLDRVHGENVKRGVTGDVFRVLKPLGMATNPILSMMRLPIPAEESTITDQLNDLYAQGFRSVAVCFIHG
jgi:5-oxoprolinase (ATP-hydrolysing)